LRETLRETEYSKMQTLECSDGECLFRTILVVFLSLQLISAVIYS